MNPSLFKQTAVQHCHDTTAALTILALPGCSCEAARRRIAGTFVLKTFELAADQVTQLLEPGAGCRLLCGEGAGRAVHGGMQCRKEPFRANESAGPREGRRRALDDFGCRGGRRAPG